MAGTGCIPGHDGLRWKPRTFLGPFKSKEPLEVQGARKHGPWNTSMTPRSDQQERLGFTACAGKQSHNVFIGK